VPVNWHARFGEQHGGNIGHAMRPHADSTQFESSCGLLAPYMAAKSGVVGISQSLARELKTLGITINCVLPGGMLSPGAMHSAPSPELRELMKDQPTAPVTDPG